MINRVRFLRLVIIVAVAVLGQPDIAGPAAEDTVTLYLKNGAAVSGKILKKTKDGYLILYEGGEVIFYNNEVERMERGVAAEQKEGLIFKGEPVKEWPYANDIVIRLTNNSILDVEMTAVSDEAVTIKNLISGGGFIEQEIPRSKIEYLTFKPIDNELSKRIEGDLRKLFPKMKFYKEGSVTIVTDSYITWVNEYKGVIRSVSTDIYLKNYKLFREERQTVQNYVVIFDDGEDFVEHAVADGVPGWAVLGYFSPDDKVLYLFNSLGDKISDFIFEALIGEPTRGVENEAGRLREHTGGKYDTLIEGLSSEIKDKFWRYYNIIKGELREQTVSTLRHEFTHEIFSNWNLQNIALSQEEKDRTRLVEKKKDFLESKDREEKRKHLIELLGIKAKEEMPDLLAANSWLAEGTATYFETDPPGSVNERWLFIFQRMKKEKFIYPLEQLSVYKLGSFPGVYPQAMLSAYAESWAFVTFLMDRYPGQFVEYQKRMANETSKGQDDINWLLAALGKDLKALEREFLEYTDRHEELEDPFVKEFEKFYDIFREFR